MDKKLTKKEIIDTTIFIIKMVENQENFKLREIVERGPYTELTYFYQPSQKVYEVLTAERENNNMHITPTFETSITDAVNSIIHKVLISQKYMIVEPKKNFPVDISFKLGLAKMLKGYDFFRKKQTI